MCVNECGDEQLSSSSGVKPKWLRLPLVKLSAVAN